MALPPFAKKQAKKAMKRKPKRKASPEARKQALALIAGGQAAQGPGPMMRA